MTTKTVTPKDVRPHTMIAEVETESGYRYWSAPLPKVQLDLWLAPLWKDGSNYLSDYCCASECWCVEDTMAALLA